MDYKKILLHRLLDKYERSKAYLDENVTRRIMLKLNSSEYPEYNIENSKTREIINSVVDELSKKEIVQYQWLKYEHGNIIEKVWLRLDKISEAYKESGRIPKSEKAATILDMVQKYKLKVTSPWIKEFLENAEAGIETKKSVSPYFPEDYEITKAILIALEALDQKEDEECLERVFSLRCYGDSKYFERNTKKKIIEVIKKYFLDEEKDFGMLGDEEILALVGIVKAPELMEFSGGMVGKLAGQPVDFSVFPHGIAINSHTVAELEITELEASTKRILFIENKANYIDYIFKKAKKNELVVYHGGFYSPPKGRFFKMIYEAGLRNEVEFIHWGDIDLGGFRMFHRLRTNIIPELYPYLMDREALISKRDYWITMDDIKYKAELEKLLGNEDYSLFHDVIKLMLDQNCRLEQEAFLFEDSQTVQKD